MDFIFENVVVEKTEKSVRTSTFISYQKALKEKQKSEGKEEKANA